MINNAHFSRLALCSSTVGLVFLNASCDSGSDDSSAVQEVTQSAVNPSGNQAPPVVTPPAGGGGTPPVDVATQREAEMATLISEHANQNRATLRFDTTLAKVARERALDMAQNGYFSHTNLSGQGPNFLVREAGYSLPSFYSQSADGNNIESIAAGNASAADTFQQWLNSPGHRRHVLAEIPFYQEQVDYGVGYAAVPGSPFRFYWVFLSAKH